MGKTALWTMFSPVMFPVPKILSVSRWLRADSASLVCLLFWPQRIYVIICGTAWFAEWNERKNDKQLLSYNTPQAGKDTEE